MPAVVCVTDPKLCVKSRAPDDAPHVSFGYGSVTSLRYSERLQWS